MKKHWKNRSILLMAVTIASMTLMGCAQKERATSTEIELGQSDLEYVQSKGTL